MVWLKACPRCHTGDLNLVSDMYGNYLQCLQCGNMQDVNLVSKPVKAKKSSGRKVSTGQRVAA
jgi:hypothetical protein